MANEEKTMPGEKAAGAGSPVSRLRLIVVAIAILVCTALELSAVEAVLWYWRPTFRPYGLTQRPNGLVFNIPQSRDNEFGFIDFNHSKEKRKGVCRIIGIDGSLGATGNLDTNLFSVMRRTFHQLGYSNVEVINDCVPATTIDMHYEMLKEFSLNYHPDVVVLLVDSVQYMADWKSSLNPIVADGLVFFDPPVRYLTWYYAKAMRMRTINLLLRDQEHIDMPWWKEGLGNLPNPKEHPAHISFRDSKPGLFSPWEYLVFNYRMLNLFQKKRSPYYLDNFKYNMDLVLKMRDLCKAKGVKFCVALFPAELQTNTYLAKAVFSYFHVDPSLYDYSIPYYDTRKWLADHDIPTVKLLRYFKKVKDPIELYPPRNMHLSDLGQKVTGEAMAETLIKDGLVPPPPGGVKSAPQPAAGLNDAARTLEAKAP